MGLFGFVHLRTTPKVANSARGPPRFAWDRELFGPLWGYLWEGLYGFDWFRAFEDHA